MVILSDSRAASLGPILSVTDICPVASGSSDGSGRMSIGACVSHGVTIMPSMAIEGRIRAGHNVSGCAA